MSVAAWAKVNDLPSQLVSTVTPDQAEEAVDFASYVLFRLSGQLYSPVQVVTEAYDTRHTLSYGTQVYPVFYGGVPYNCGGIGFGGNCACCCANCGVFHRTRLRGYPVRGVYDVWVDGVKLAPDEFVVLDNAVLGLKATGYCNVRCLVVRYAYGTGVPPGGKLAVAKLAEQLLLSASGENCDLPSRVTSVSRQGMSWTLLDPQDFLDKGRTGIYEIDLMLSALNPAHALARPRVFSPDLPRAQVVLTDEPPLSVLLDPDDQVVIAGSPTQWETEDPDVIYALLTKMATTTEIGPIAPASEWKLVSPTRATLDLTGQETARMADQDPYTVSSAGVLLLSGQVRVL